ncbi:hypothetical protein M0804_003803 [Polistes exclamans]|nr:hypothetical protein M0804_003803 [Polistes exclamans]
MPSFWHATCPSTESKRKKTKYLGGKEEEEERTIEKVNLKGSGAWWAVLRIKDRECSCLLLQQQRSSSSFTVYFYRPDFVLKRLPIQLELGIVEIGPIV